jgi:hypothetical protein
MSPYSDADVLAFITHLDDGGDPPDWMMEAEDPFDDFTLRQYGWIMAALERRAFRFAIEFRKGWEANPGTEVPDGMPVFMFDPPVPDDVSALDPM